MIYYKDFPFENPCFLGSPETLGPGGTTKLKLQVSPLCFLKFLLVWPNASGCKPCLALQGK